MRKSQKQELLERFELIEIQQTWVKFGMYEGAKRLENSNPFVLFHLACDLKWSRPLPTHLQVAVRNNSWKTSERHYIPGEEVNHEV